MKTKRIILTLFFISNLLFLPKICLAVAPSNIFIVNRYTKNCGIYSIDYFTLINYQPPSNWKKVYIGSTEYAEYCQGKKIEHVKPRILGLNLWGYFLLSFVIVVILVFLRLILLTLNLFVAKKIPKIGKLLKITSSIFRYSLFILYFVFMSIIIYYILDIVRDVYKF